ncbi:hypothetical protein GUJ93_ZPchr0013g37630 [Zizania palustris]|uniref:Uncharacterized protein n=1 Tax=Zizania palustris TaxID=103762 RepID=A0A8J6BYD5_ZIZPA|nr:hypothetical protein GUJ93_ZPchr0013g37630 [Zizania palustris]
MAPASAREWRGTCGECVGALRRAGEAFCVRGGMGGDVRLVMAMGRRRCRSTGRSGWRWQAQVRRRGARTALTRRCRAWARQQRGCRRAAERTSAPGAVRAARLRGCRIWAQACGLAQPAACGLAEARRTAERHALARDGRGQQPLGWLRPAGLGCYLTINVGWSRPSEKLGAGRSRRPSEVENDPNGRHEDEASHGLKVDENSVLTKSNEGDASASDKVARGIESG